jgi:hypothetical protein
MVLVFLYNTALTLNCWRLSERKTNPVYWIGEGPPAVSGFSNQMNE